MKFFSIQFVVVAVLLIGSCIGAPQSLVGEEKKTEKRGIFGGFGYGGSGYHGGFGHGYGFGHGHGHGYGYGSGYPPYYGHSYYHGYPQSFGGYHHFH